MAYPRKIRNFNAFVDGVSYFGLVVSAKLPELKSKTEDFRGSGIFGANETIMGQQKMEAELTMAEWAPALLTAWGKKSRLVLRPASMGEDDFEATPYIFTMGGRMRDITPDELKPTEEANLKLNFAVNYFKAEVDGAQLLEIDVENAVHNVGGEDHYESMRSAMGI